MGRGEGNENTLRGKSFCPDTFASFEKTKKKKIKNGSSFRESIIGGGSAETNKTKCGDKQKGGGGCWRGGRRRRKRRCKDEGNINEIAK